MKIILTENDVKEILSVHVHEAYGINAGEITISRYYSTDDFCVIQEAGRGENDTTE